MKAVFFVRKILRRKTTERPKPLKTAERKTRGKRKILTDPPKTCVNASSSSKQIQTSSEHAAARHRSVKRVERT